MTINEPFTLFCIPFRGKKSPLNLQHAMMTQASFNWFSYDGQSDMWSDTFGAAVSSDLININYYYWATLYSKLERGGNVHHLINKYIIMRYWGRVLKFNCSQMEGPRTICIYTVYTYAFGLEMWPPEDPAPWTGIQPVCAHCVIPHPPARCSQWASPLCKSSDCQSYQPPASAAVLHKLIHFPEQWEESFMSTVVLVAVIEVVPVFVTTCCRCLKGERAVYYFRYFLYCRNCVLIELLIDLRCLLPWTG